MKRCVNLAVVTIASVTLLVVVVVVVVIVAGAPSVTVMEVAVVM